MIIVIINFLPNSRHAKGFFTKAATRNTVNREQDCEGGEYYISRPNQLYAWKREQQNLFITTDPLLIIAF